MDENFTIPEELSRPNATQAIGNLILSKKKKEGDCYGKIRRKIPLFLTLSGFTSRCIANTSYASAVSTDDLKSLFRRRLNEVCKRSRVAAVPWPLDCWDIPSVKMYLHFISLKPSSAASDLFAFGGLGGFWLGNESSRKRMRNESSRKRMRDQNELWTALSKKVKSCGANVLMPLALLLRTPLCSCREGMSCLCSDKSKVGCHEKEGGKHNTQFTFPSYLSIDKKKGEYHPPGELTIQPVDNPTFFTSQQDSKAVVSEQSIDPDELCDCQKDAMNFAVCLSLRQCLIISVSSFQISHQSCPFL